MFKFLKKECIHDLFIIYEKSEYGSCDYSSKVKCTKCMKEYMFYNNDEMHNTIAFYNKINHDNNKNNLILDGGNL